jgi:hypothetical protein
MGLLEQRRTFHAEDDVLPTYSLEKQKKKRKKFRIPNGLLAIITLALFFGITIYLPPMILKDSDPFVLQSKTVITGESALSDSITYLRNNPDEDFDEDGLTNEKEMSLGTSAYSIDSDGDNVTDYAELYIVETSPKIAGETITNFIKGKDAESGKQVNSPIKVHNVVLWPDDYNSRAKGGVVRTYEGYRFHEFFGWAQFPEGNYAYKIVNGDHVELAKNEQGYFYIDGGDVAVRLYNDSLTMAYQVKLIGGSTIRIDDNIIGKALHFILPKTGRGIIVCRKAAAIDIDNTREIAGGTAKITLPETIQLSETRFGRSMNKLTDLADIFSAIDNGNCVVLSLFSHEKGEAFVLAYGYTYRGNIFVADIKTGEKLGAINFSERASRLLDKSGELQQYEWFAFNGCGFDSNRSNRISIVQIVYLPETIPGLPE